MLSTALIDKGCDRLPEEREIAAIAIGAAGKRGKKEPVRSAGVPDRDELPFAVALELVIQV